MPNQFGGKFQHDSAIDSPFNRLPIDIFGPLNILKKTHGIIAMGPSRVPGLVPVFSRILWTGRL